MRRWMPRRARRAGISDTLLRLSVGIEAAEDLIADLQSGLERAAAVQLVVAVPAER